MYKNLLLYAMLAGASIRVLSAAVLAAMGQLNLPSSLVILSLIIAFLGFVLGIKRVVSGVRLVELVLYQAVADIGAVVSMIALHFYMVDIPLVETLVTGSVLSILASIVCWHLRCAPDGISQSISRRNKMSNKFQPRLSAYQHITKLFCFMERRNQYDGRI